MQFTELTLERGKSFLVKECKEEALMGFVTFVRHTQNTCYVTTTLVTFPITHRLCLLVPQM